MYVKFVSFIINYFIFSVAVSALILPLQAAACQSTIIYLKGSCSAGKSTFIQALDTKMLNLEVIDEDEAWVRTCNEAVAQRFPEAIKAIQKAVAEENLFRALCANCLIFKKDITPEVCLGAKNAISRIQNELNQPCNVSWRKSLSEGVTSDLLERIREAIERKKNILLDSWYIKPDLLQARFPQARTVRVLLYCSMPETYQRLLKRNLEAVNSANLTNHRFTGQFVGSFCSIYQLSKEPVQPIEKVDPKQLNKLFATIEATLGDDQFSKPIFTFNELSKARLRTIQATFMQPTVDDPTANYYISPKEPQDYIFDNMTQEANVCLIKEIIANQSSSVSNSEVNAGETIKSLNKN